MDVPGLVALSRTVNAALDRAHAALCAAPPAGWTLPPAGSVAPHAELDALLRYLGWGASDVARDRGVSLSVAHAWRRGAKPVPCPEDEPGRPDAPGLLPPLRRLCAARALQTWPRYERLLGHGGAKPRAPAAPRPPSRDRAETGTGAAAASAPA